MKRCAIVVEWINCAWSVIYAILNGFARTHDEGNWGRKTVSWVVLYVTLRSLEWSFEYTISQSGKPGIETAAVIAAVMGPISLMQAAVIKFYFEANTRTEQIAAGQAPSPPAQIAVAATATTKGV